MPIDFHSDANRLTYARRTPGAEWADLMREPVHPAGAREVAADLRARTGRSILHELTDSELDDPAAYIEAEPAASTPITRATSGPVGRRNTGWSAKH
ncbi:hypothetical protein [Embleya sp. NPDC001921]